jgi:hypothetical protein
MPNTGGMITLAEGLPPARLLAISTILAVGSFYSDCLRFTSLELPPFCTLLTRLCRLCDNSLCIFVMSAGFSVMVIDKSQYFFCHHWDRVTTGLIPKALKDSL